MTRLEEVYRENVRRSSETSLLGREEKLCPAFVSCSETGDRLTLRIPVEGWMTNRQGFVMPGMLTYIFDDTMGLVYSPYMGNYYYVTLNIAVHYHGPAAVGDALIMESTLVHADDRTNFISATIKRESDGAPVGSAEGLFMRVPGRTYDPGTALYKNL